MCILMVTLLALGFAAAADDPPAWELDPVVHRGLFAPDETVAFDLRCRAPGSHALRWRLRDHPGNEVASGTLALEVAAGDTVEQRLTVAERLPRGWYRLELERGTDEPLQRFLVVVPPATTLEDPQASHFGLCKNGLRDPRRIADDPNHYRAEYAAMRRLGVRWLRGTGTLWHWMQRVEPGEDWRDKPIGFAHSDAHLALHQELGFATLGTLFYSTGWASGQEQWWGQSFHPPSDLTPEGPYYNWVRSMVARYAERGVTRFEHWNEPDSNAFFKGTPQQYAAMLDLAQAAVEAGHPDAVLLSGAWVGTGLQQAREIIPASERIGATELCLHGYMSTPRKILPTKRLYRAHGLPTDRIWVTETGLEPNLGDSQTVDAAHLRRLDEHATQVVRAFGKYRLWGADHVFWFCWAWAPYGLIGPQGPRPAAATYRLLAEATDHPASFAGTLDLGPEADSCWALAYRHADGAAIVTWRDREDQLPRGREWFGETTIPIDRGATAVLHALDGRELGRMTGPGVAALPIAELPHVLRITGPVTGLESRLGWTPRYGDEVACSIAFDAEGQIADGMHAHVPRGRGPVEVAGRWCYVVATGREGEDQATTNTWYLPVELNHDAIHELFDAFGLPREPLRIRITYLDQGSEPFGMHPDHYHRGAIPRRDSGEWKTTTVDLAQGGVPSQDGHCAFRITNWGWNRKQQPLHVARVELIRGVAE